MVGSECRSTRSFKDPLYGYVDVCSELVPVIDSPLFQRLRRIKQTAFANLVYHGMEHSRFTHSMGVAHLARDVIFRVADNTRFYYGIAGARRIADDLVEGSTIFQLAALLHDAGHLPFSHASEVGIHDARVFLEVREAEELPTSHEEYTMSLVNYFAERVGGEVSSKYTGRGLADDVALVLGRPSGIEEVDPLSKCTLNVFNSLLMGGIDIDRMDYLQRDSLFAGVRYGLFDVDRLTRMLLATPLTGKGEADCSIAVIDKGLTVVETFLLSRFYMFSEVYLHRVVETYNSVYARLFAIMLENRVIGPSGSMLRIPLPSELEGNDEEALREWEKLDDLTMTFIIRSIAEGAVRLETHREEARMLAKTILERRHPRSYKAVDDYSLWATYKVFLEHGPIDPSLEQVYRELVEIQRERPDIIVRPLQAGLETIKDILVFDREEGRVERIEDVEDRGKGLEAYQAVVERIRKLANISIRRVIVLSASGYNEYFHRAVKLVEEARKIAKENVAKG